MKASFLSVALLGAVAAVSVSFAGDPAPKTAGIEIEALKLKGDKVNGEEVYGVCGSCHMFSGGGRRDGSTPQLAGQHTTVLIKQMADISSGRRDNPAMYPFATALSNPQELADLAAHIESLCIPTNNGKYESDNAAAQIVKGKALYQRQCLECHGTNGEGIKEKFYPVIAGQHYEYLLRQMTEIRDGHRRNANPEMVTAIKPYTNDMLVAISAYQASLKMPGAMCKEKAAKK